jgi:hypothetical protein
MCFRWRGDFELNHEYSASAIFGRQGDHYSTSDVEAFAAGARRVFAAKWFIPGGLEVPSGGDFLPEEGHVSILPLLLGGDALRMPTIYGGDAQGPDCFSNFCSSFVCVYACLIFKY